MAKKKTIRKKAVSGTNRSAAIREHLESNPGAGNQAIKEDLAKKGIEVSDTLISSVRKRAGAPLRKRKVKRGRPAKATLAVAGKVTKKETMFALADLKAAKKFAGDIGGVEKARTLFDALASL